MLHASRAFTLQFVDTLASVAAASESLSFSAYDQIAELRLLAADASDEAGERGASSGSTERRVAGDWAGDCTGENAGDMGEGGGSIAAWFVMPFQTVCARRALSVACWGSWTEGGGGSGFASCACSSSLSLVVLSLSSSSGTSGTGGTGGGGGRGGAGVDAAGAPQIDCRHRAARLAVGFAVTAGVWMILCFDRSNAS